MKKEVREGYKMTELGEIPEDWKIRKLKDIANICYGKSQKEVEMPNGKYKILGTGGIIGYTNDFLWDKPSVLIGRKGTINKPQYIEEPFWTVDTLFYTKINKEYVAKWFYYYLNNINLKKYNEATGVPSLSASNLNSIKIIVPTYEEQEKIVSILSTVDEQIDNVDALIEKNKELKKGLMQTLLTKGIGHTKFKKTEIGEIPEEWEVKKLCAIVDVVSGATPKTTVNEYWDEGNIYWATPTDITSNGKYISKTEKRITEIGLKSCSAKLLPKGSILMSSRATIGERCINVVPMATNQGFKSLICKDGTSNQFIYYYIDILKDKFLLLASGSTFLEISKKVVEDIKVALPSTEEQEKIASILSDVDKKIEEYENKKEKLEELKKGLMQQLLTGKIRVI